MEDKLTKKIYEELDFCIEQTRDPEISDENACKYEREVGLHFDRLIKIKELDQQKELELAKIKLNKLICYVEALIGLSSNSITPVITQASKQAFIRSQTIRVMQYEKKDTLTSTPSKEIVRGSFKLI